MTKAIFFLKKNIYIIVFMTFCSSLVAAHEGATGIVKERMEGMKGLSASMKSITQIERALKPLTAAMGDAENIVQTARLIPKQFPAQSYAAPSTANPLIDQERSLFNQRAAELEKAGMVLLDAIQKGDRDAFASARMNIGRSCSSCHRTFRVRKK